jgi:light-regulated signal transduction histidine kinase (bacteriophytochrome)
MPIPKENLVYAIAKNITHKKELDKERATHLFKLARTNKDLKNLNYKTSHDLRSPVNNILTLCDLLDLSKVTDSETLKIINFIQLSTQGLKNSLDEYIDSLKKADTQESNIEEVMFANVLSDVKTSVSAIIEDSKTEFSCDFSELESVPFNKAYMVSIFLNFITNSIKYARPDVYPEIKISTKEEEGKKMLIYTDNGLGFNMDAVSDKIFNLNQRFHDNKDSKGVGLYLVHTHVTDLGGTVRVDSKVNKGATFTITFK